MSPARIKTWAYGLELRIEPLVTITDFRDQPARRIPATLREWEAILKQAAASLEERTAASPMPHAPVPAAPASSWAPSLA